MSPDYCSPNTGTSRRTARTPGAPAIINALIGPDRGARQAPSSIEAADSGLFDLLGLGNAAPDDLARSRLSPGVDLFRESGD